MNIKKTQFVEKTMAGKLTFSLIVFRETKIKLTVRSHFTSIKLADS